MSTVENEVRAHLDDLFHTNPPQYEMVRELRAMVFDVAPEASEEVKYGGLLFSTDAPFCGIFSYTHHVSIEFLRGCDLDDTSGVLEGSGKYRRHIKIDLPEDVSTKHIRSYISQAYTNSLQAS